MADQYALFKDGRQRWGFRFRMAGVAQLAGEMFFVVGKRPWFSGRRLQRHSDPALTLDRPEQ